MVGKYKLVNCERTVALTDLGMVPFDPHVDFTPRTGRNLGGQKFLVFGLAAPEVPGLPVGYSTQNGPYSDRSIKLVGLKLG